MIKGREEGSNYTHQSCHGHIRLQATSCRNAKQTGLLTTLNTLSHGNTCCHTFSKGNTAVASASSAHLAFYASSQRPKPLRVNVSEPAARWISETRAPLQRLVRWQEPRRVLGCWCDVIVRGVATSQCKVVQAELHINRASVLEPNLIHTGQITVELGDRHGQLSHAIACGAPCEGIQLNACAVVLLLCIADREGNARWDSRALPNCGCTGLFHIQGDCGSIGGKEWLVPGLGC